MEITEWLETVLDGLQTLGTVDLDALPGETLDNLVTGLLALQPRLDAATCRAVDRWDALGRWTLDGSRSATQRLANDGGCSRRTAGMILRRGRALRSMPATLISLGAGRITVDHVDLLAAAANPQRSGLFARDETTLVEACERLHHAQAAKAVAYWRRRADAELGVDGTPPDDRCRHLDIAPGVDGDFSVSGVLDPLGGTEVITALERIAAELAGDDGPTRTKAERYADALVEMARRATAMPTGARKPRPLVTVVVGHHRFVELCELATGQLLSTDDLVPYLHHLDVEQIVFDGPLRAVGTSPSRCFTGALRRVIEVRDRHCQHPSGCDVPASECDIDHIVPHSRGGATDQHNGRLACRYHNRIQPQIATPPPSPDPR